MTQQEYKQLLHQLPDSIIQEYKLNPNVGLEDEKYININGYKYYYEIPCLLVDDVPVVWSKDTPYIKPKLQPHIDAIKKRINGRRHQSIGIVYKTKHTNRLYCVLKPKDSDVTGLNEVKFDETAFYYDPNKIDLTHDETFMILAKVLFIANRYERECIVPSKDLNPENWE